MAKSTIFSLGLVAIFAIVAGFALLHPGLPPTHDGEYHVIRFYEFDKALRDGNWYPRWAPDLNYGYGVPLFNYVYPLPNYVASLFHLFGISFIDAFKLQMFFASILGGVFFYLWSKEFWGNLGGMVSSVFYTFSPYHFVDIYIRGSVGEVWAIAFFPAFLWSATKFFKEQRIKFVGFSAIFLLLIIFSHNILSLMFFPFVLSYMGFTIYQMSKESRRFFMQNTAYIVLLGLGLSSIFWLPALAERNFVTGLQVYNIEDNFPQLYQLIFPSWGSGFSTNDLMNQMSFQIGVANLLTVILSALVAIKSIKEKNKSKFIVFFFLIWFAVIFFLMLKISLPLWQSIPFMNYFQFPWRFLSLEILVASFMAGSLIKIRRSKIIAGFMVLLAFFLGIGYAQPAYYYNRDDKYYITRPNFIDGTNSPGNVFSTVWMDRNLRRQNKKLVGTKNIIELKPEIIKSTDYKFVLAAKKDVEITINTAYFPGWTGFIDGKSIWVSRNIDGLISFFLPKGAHKVEIKFDDTPMRMLGKVGFFLSIIFTFFCFGRSKKRKFISYK